MYIQEYLEERVENGEELLPETPLEGFDPRGVKKNQFLRTTLITRDIKQAILRAGFSWRPYLLRAYCYTNACTVDMYCKYVEKCVSKNPTRRETAETVTFHAALAAGRT